MVGLVLAWFESFRKPAGGNNLRPLYPTRWTMRVSSVKSVLANYESLASSTASTFIYLFGHVYGK